MALSFTFSGNVVDKDENSLECNYQVYYYRQNVVSDIKRTDQQQYNTNAGQDDQLTINGELRNGDIILIRFWNDSNDQFCIYKAIYNGGLYIAQDVKLLDSQSPSGTLNVSNVVLGQQSISSVVASDEYQYSYAGTTLYHKNNWYGFNLINEVGVNEILYNYDNNGFSNSNTYVFDSIGEYGVDAKIINNSNKETVLSDTFRILKAEPTISIYSSPSSPNKNELVNISIENTDMHSSIVSQTYYIDDIEVSELQHSFSEIRVYIFKVSTLWSDGFNEYTKTTTHTIDIASLPIVIDLEKSNIDNIYSFDINETLGDGALASVLWKIFYKLPFSDNQVEVYQTYGNAQEDFTFVNSGEYRVVATATCEFGTSDTDYENIVLVSDITECEQSRNVVDVTKYKFRFDGE
jgi:hypothetical protein